LLVNLGVLYRRLGDPIRALSTYDQARAEFARDHDVDGELNTVKNRGIVLALDLSRLDEAERSFSAAIDTATKIGNRREMLHSRLYRGETRLRSDHRDDARDDFSAGLALARELKTPEEEWKALYGLGRLAPNRAQAVSHLQAAVETIEQVREGIRVPSLRAEFLNDKREVYDALIAASLPSANTDALFGMLERSHSRGWRERLHLDTPIDLAGVRRALPARTLLIDYWHAPQAAAVVAATATRAATFPLHVDESRLRTLVDALAAGPSDRWRQEASAVAAQILPPADWFDGIDHIIVVPDGPIALVPFDVLPVGSQLLVERAAVSYSPTAATLLRPATITRWLPPWKPQFLGFADPVDTASEFDAETAAGRLTASAAEVQHAAGELGGRAELHIGADNRKAYLLEAADRAPILHLATHAFADTGALERSRIIFSPPDKSGSNPDYLFLREAYALKLDGIDLAVLSACETERGRVVRGEGVQSFSRAFLAAGVRATVTTMWRVADEPTSDFMQVFYHHLNRGEPRDEALRRAKLRFLGGTTLANPHYWASFVLTGDGLRPIPRAITWTMVIGTLIAVTVAGAIAVGWRRRKKSVPR
jgi:CHAT domain-containing protein